jgi:hypothetical protein
MELEQASVETFVDTVDVGGGLRAGSKEIKVELPSETQLRGVVRPSLEVHPTDSFLLEVLTYLKYPLRDQRKDGRLDYRVDGVVRAKLTLDPDEVGQEKVSLIWELRQNYDNTPPSIPKAVQDAEGLQGRVFRRSVNEKKHQSALFKISVGW